MKFFLCVITFFSIFTIGIYAQAPSNDERARPSLAPDYENYNEEEMENSERISWQNDKEKEWWSYLMSANSTENFYFVNKNMTVETPATTQPQNESSIAINPTNPDNIISAAVDYRGNVIYISTDGGKSWRDTIFKDVRYMYLKDTVKNGVPKIDTTYKTWRIGNDPSVGFDDKGNCIVMYGAFPNGSYTGESGVYLDKSTDGGKTWLTHVKVIEHKGTMTKDSAFEDKYYIQIDNSKNSAFYGRMYTPWKRVTDRDSATQIVFTHSTDGGLTWAEPVPVSPRKTGISTDTTFGQSFPISSTGPNGEVYVAWNDGPMRSIGFAKSTDGGVTFSQPTYPVKNYPTLGTARKVKDGNVYHVLKNTFRAETYPTLTVDNSQSGNRGNIYLAYASGTSPKVRFMRSSDGGNTWSNPVIVHSDTTNDKWWPWINVDVTSGDIAITYSDSRDDPANITIEQYVSYSSDGGLTWLDNKMSDFASDYRKNPFVDNIFAGDYSGNAFYNGKIYPSYLDTREGKPSLLDNDVFTAIVSLMQPKPVENLKVTSSLTKITEGKLTWKNPAMETMFKKPITDYNLLIEKDGKPLKTLSAGTTEYLDNVVDSSKEYLYTVRVATKTDTSVLRSVTFSPQNVIIPAPPKIISINDYQPQLTIRLAIPPFRADSATTFDNPQNYMLFRDGVKIQEGSIENQTGKTLELTDSPPRGYYRYSALVTDRLNNQSKSSDTLLVYCGDGSLYKENFDATPPKFLIPTGWGTAQNVALSQPYSFTDSPQGKYLPSKNNALHIYPVEITDAGIELTFSHICILDKADSAIVEISLDKGQTWSKVASYNLNSYTEWKDSVASNADWKKEFLIIKKMPNMPPNKTYCIARFRLKTTSLNELDGWYIDDIEFGKTASVNEEKMTNSFASIATPNPFSSTVIVSFFVPQPTVTELVLFDALGKQVMEMPIVSDVVGYCTKTINAENLPNGVYYYRLKNKFGNSRGKLLKVKL